MGIQASDADGVAADRSPDPEAASRGIVNADLPGRPAGRPGCVVELVLKAGRWAWQQRRMDAADQVYAAYLSGKGY